MQTYSPIFLNFTINTAVMNFPHCFEPNNCLDVDSLNTDSNGDTIAIAVGEVTAFVAVFQEMIDNYYNNFIDNNDGDDVSSVAQ